MLEHRADKQEMTIEKIGEWMRELTKSQAELVKLQTQRVQDVQRLERLERRVDESEKARVAQHEQTREWAAAEGGLSAINASWVDWFKALLIGVIGATVGAGITAIFFQGVGG